ncbi:MAG TPA: tetratricopeptide repeat protein [Myxococcales bacterium]|nr:tetratricopeptide repeat protein [Myxococcales bacterium]
MSLLMNPLKQVIVALLALSFLISVPSFAQQRTKKKSLSVKVIGDKGGKKKFERSGPQTFMDARRSKRDRMVAEALDDAIASLQAVIEFEDPNDPSFPQSLIRLASLHWEKSEEFQFSAQSTEMLKAIYAAEESKDAQAIAKIRAKQQVLRNLQNEWRQKAIDSYRQIEQKYSDFKELDEVLFALGTLLSKMKKLESGKSYFVKLIRVRPNSERVADAFLNIGDYFFEKNDFEQAIAFYQKVQHYRDKLVVGWATYMEGWCYFNMGDKAKAMDRFLKSIQWSDKQKKAGHFVVLDPKEQAQQDMVRAYPFLKNASPAKAVGFFKRYAPKIYIKLCEKLVGLYTADANYNSANILLRRLIKEIGRKDFRQMAYSRQILRNIFESGDKQGTKTEIIVLARKMKKYSPALAAEFQKEERAELEQLISRIGTEYHRESEKTLGKAAQELALTVYEHYLAWFPDAKNYYTMTYNVAILAYQMKEYTRAAKLFERVLEIKPNGEYTAAAAHTVLLSYYKLIDVTAVDEKVSENIDEEFKKRPIPEKDQKLVTACERYIQAAPPGSDDLAEAKYAAAKIYYDANHFAKAAQYFEQMYRDHKDHPQTTDAARLLLSIFNVTRDIRNLNKWADTFSADPAIASGELGAKVKEIKAARDFNRCRQMEFDKKFGQAGDCFMTYFKNFRQAKLGDKALNNAAIMYRNAKMISKALQASATLYEERQDSPIAPQALFNIATIYKTIAIYDEAAHHYELYAKRHPDHNRKLLERALARAAVYRRALGDYDKAIEDYIQYYKRFSDNPKAPLVFFEIGLMFESQKRWWLVIKHYSKYLKTYGKTARAGHVITANMKMGLSFWKIDKKKPAMKYFEQTLSMFNKLQEEHEKAGTIIPKEDAGLVAEAVAAAKFYQGEVILKQMKRVKLKLPQKKFTKLLNKKVRLIEKATKQMQEVAQFKRPHWEIAAFNRIGQAFQNLADAIENAPIPRRLNEEAKYMLQEDFRKKANMVRAKAVQAYRRCLETAKKKQWFNEFSDNAEKNLAILDLNYKFTREIRPQPGFYRSNSTVPSDKKVGDSGPTPGLADYNKGLAHERNGQWQQAHDVYSSSIRQEAGLADAHARLGLMKIRTGQSNGMAGINNALRLEKHNPTANNFMAEQVQKESNWPKSVGHSRQALIGNADSMNAYQNLAFAYYRTGKHQMAKLVCEQALEISPNNAAIHNLRGMVWLKLKDVRSAIRSFAKAVESTKQLFEGHLNLASTVLNYADFTRAKRHYDVVLKAEPANADAILGQAVALRGMNQFDLAQKNLESILDKRPNAARYNLCLLHGEYKGEYDKAVVRCREFVSGITNKHPKYKEVRKRIKGLESTIKMLREDEELRSSEEKLNKESGGNDKTTPVDSNPQDNDTDADSKAKSGK